jgi:hypothetical protein
MAVDHKKIRHLLGEKEESTDHGLGAKSLRRALSGDVPKTLTPYEWEQWYADHGVPDGHLAPEEEQRNTSKFDRTPTYAIWLGRAGLLPFVGLLLALYIDAQNQSLWANALATYTLAIICFLVGAWWGTALIQVLLSTAGFFLLGAFVFTATLVIERRHALIQTQPLYYARLRLQLTLVASTSLVLAAMLM